MDADPSIIRVTDASMRDITLKQACNDWDKQEEDTYMKDMTQGKPLKLIIGFAIPMLIDNIFQQIYNVADTVIVGRFLGESALAGVGSTGTLTYFLLTCIMSLIGIFGAEFFLRLLSVSENVISYSAEYLHVIYTFVFGSVIYNGCAAILNSVGDSKTPLRAVIASSVVNIAFDLFFIIVCKMGVAGSAYATILAQCTLAVICFAKVLKVREEIGLSLMKWKPEAGYIHLVVKTGFPAAFQSCMIALGGMSVQRLVNAVYDHGQIRS